jgi:hypothetical protein
VVCGDGIVNGSETCDPGAPQNDPNCPSCGTCGDGIVSGAEDCDDGMECQSGGDTGNPCTDNSQCVNDDCAPSVNDGCDDACAWEPGQSCVGNAPNYVCQPTTCGDGVLGNLEECDDGCGGDGCSGADDGDGCNQLCQLEPLYTCEGDIGELSVCEIAIQFVPVRAFNVSFIQPESLLYDPNTRSFVGYKTPNTQVPIELCLDGTQIIHPSSSSQGIYPPGCEDALCKQPVPPSLVRQRPYNGAIAGATYDPTAGNWLLLNTSGTLVRVADVHQQLAPLATAAVPGGGEGIAVGDDTRLYVARNASTSVAAFNRNATAIGFDLSAPANSWVINVSTGGDKLDDLFNLSGFNLIGTFTDLLVEFWDYGSTGNPETPVASSLLPGDLFADTFVDGVTPFTSSMFNAYLGAGETATDGSGFIVCSNNPSNDCFLFAQVCDDDSDCTGGAECINEGGTSFCSGVAKARNDYTTAAAGDPDGVIVPVLDNDSISANACANTDVEVTSVETPTLHGGPPRSTACSPPTGSNATCASTDSWWSGRRSSATAWPPAPVPTACATARCGCAW